VIESQYLGAMRILRSYRWRRRLVIGTVTVGVAAPLIYLGIHFSHPAAPTEATGPEVEETFYQQPKHAAFTAENRRKVRKVLAKFISTAVARRHVAESWPIVGPTLRSGLSRKEWSTGDIPVQPYPVSQKGVGDWEYVEYSYPKAIGLEVLLWPKPGSGQQLLSADIKVIKDRRGRWRVDYFMPKRFHAQEAAPAPHKAKTKKHQAHAKRQTHANQRRAAAPSSPNVDEGPRVGKVWWAIPLGLLALIILAPISFAVFVWIRNRRADAEYMRSRR